jgi:hypothetical protein
MNKKTIISVITLLGLLGTVGSALAASDFTISLPSGTSYNPGQTFTANVIVSPVEKIYTVGIQLDYPANLMRVESFNFASTWMPLSQEGYDSINNTTGLLIKTAGYPGGITSSKTIGTVTFKALNSGQGTIQLTSDSFALNAQNTNITGNLGISQIVIKTNEVIPEEQTPEENVTPEEITQPEEEITPEEITQPEEIISNEEETTVLPQDEILQNDQPSLLLASLEVIQGSAWMTITIIVCLLGLVVIGIREWESFKNKSKE